MIHLYWYVRQTEKNQYHEKEMLKDRHCFNKNIFLIHVSTVFSNDSWIYNTTINSYVSLDC